MYEDGRSKKVVFVAHCILNQNSISDGTAVFPAAFKDVIQFFLDADVGIVQMPCPEFCCLGLDRGNIHGAESPVVVENTRIRRAIQEPQPYAKLTRLAQHVAEQITAYRENGFEVLGIVGANRSPNCGVNTTSDHDEEIPGMGVFMETLTRLLADQGITLPMVGLKGSDNFPEKLGTLLP